MSFQTLPFDPRKNEYFEAPPRCQSKGGLYNFVCKYHAQKTGRKSVCLYREKWKPIGVGFKCPNKEWQNDRINPENKKTND